MLPLYGLMFLTLEASGIKLIDNNSLDKTNDINVDIETPETFTISPENATNFQGGSNSIRLWNSFITVLVNATTERLETAKENIKNNYNLNNVEVKSVHKIFDHAHAEYEQFLHYYLKKYIEMKTFNTSRAFMLDFMDLSNYLFGQIVEYNLAKVKGQLNLATKWYQLSLRQKVTRQQVKIATNYIEAHICYVLEICKERTRYSQYLIEWVRHFMDFSPSKMKKLFSALSELIAKNDHKLKSNMKFRKTVKSIGSGTVGAQRDTLDYIDEILTDRDNIVHFVPDHLRKGASLLTNLLTLIDENYEVNAENVDELEDITETLYEFIQKDNMDINTILNDILDNMVSNVKEFKPEAKSKLGVIWSQIILL